MRPRLTFIVPFHKGLGALEQVLRALTPVAPGDEVIVAADGAVDDCRSLAATHGTRLVEIDGPKGPAVARNAAAASAVGDVLVFVDADVVASPETVERLASVFETRPDVTAVFGSYDESPGSPGFVSTYKNLAHAFVHRDAAGHAETFWTGFGAVRRTAFHAVGGFDKRFERPSIEDIDLGYRLSERGHLILLDPTLTVCHLKHWTLWGMVKSDVFDRGIPWTQLILRYRRFGGGLNARGSYRLAVVLAYLAVAAAVLTVFDGTFGAPLLFFLVALIYLGADYSRFFWQKRGAWFAIRVIPLHFLYHLYNGVSFGVGAILFFLVRYFAVRPAGSLPAHALDPQEGAAALVTSSASFGPRDV